MTEIMWEHDLQGALERAGRERRFVLVDFSKEKKLHKAQTIFLSGLLSNASQIFLRLRFVFLIRGYPQRPNTGRILLA